MPELPELEVLKEHLISELTGKRIERFRLLKPYILKNVFDGDLHGETVCGIARRGKYLSIQLDAFTIVLHLMLRGYVRVTARYRVKKSIAAFIKFTDGSCMEIAETGAQKMMKISVYRNKERIPHLERLGYEPLAPEFDVRTLQKLLHKESCHLRSFLRSQRSIAGIGNAYADEILWTAELSPFRLTSSMNEQDTVKLFNALRDVLANAIVQVKRSARSKKRSFLNIHGKKGIPCPRCRDHIRTISFSRGDVYYCPTCQTRGRMLKDRRMSKFFR